MQIPLPILALLLAVPTLRAQDQGYDAGVHKPTHSEVSYGPHGRNVLDFWQAKSDKPTPLVLVIHGGGWTSGSKERVSRFANVQALLDAGISVAANNYRLMAHAKDVVPPVKAHMVDSARALQFLRSKAKEWSIDPTRIAAAGGSAGACTSLWLAYHDDLADAKSEDIISYDTPPAMGKDQKDPTHSANFGIGLQQRCRELGIGCDVIYPDKNSTKLETPTEYLIEMLTAR